MRNAHYLIINDNYGYKKTTHHSYTGISMSPGFCTKERETDHTEVHKYPIIRGYAKSGKAKRIHFLL